jgi:hypothetical protein
MASQFGPGEFDQKRIVAFAELGKEIEESRGSLELKYRARWIFAGEAFDRSAAPYQDFALLTALRNALIHYKLVDKFYATEDGPLRMEIPKIVEQLRSKNVLADSPSHVGAPWISRITTPAMARWACLSSAAMIKEIVEIAPKGVFRTGIELVSRHLSARTSLNDKRSGQRLHFSIG